MSWSPMSKPAGLVRGADTLAAVSVAATVKSLRTSAGLHIILRPYLMQDAPAFLAVDTPVSVMLGHAEHAGMLRIQPGGAFTLRRTPGNKVDRAVLQLRAPLPPGVPEGRQKPHSVEFDYGDAWLEITLPEWARPPGGGTTPPSRAAQLAAEAAEIARRKAGLGAR